MSKHQHIINNRRLCFGPRDELMAISPAKHKWWKDVWDQMLANTWTVNEVNVSEDGECYRKVLTDGERRAYDFALSFTSNLDGIQLHNLTNNVSRHITSPEVEMCITRQAFEEALHVQAYSQLVETVSNDPMSVYMRFEHDGMLAKKNDYMMAQSRILTGEATPAQFARAIVANMVLEGISFYGMFLVFYTLARNGKMIGSADMVKFINRDERTHLHLFKNMFWTMRQENPEVFDAQFYRDAEQIIRGGTEIEIDWSQYVIKDGVLGLSNPIVSSYIQHLANEIAKLIGMPDLYPGAKNPVPWVDKFAALGKEKEMTNFFEGKETSYSVGTLGDWD